LERREKAGGVKRAAMACGVVFSNPARVVGEEAFLKGWKRLAGSVADI
jgi:hypothetical protein